MGLHSFDGMPQHLKSYGHLPPNLQPEVFGVEQRWNMPLSIQELELPDGAYFDGANHYVMTLHVGGGPARRTDSPKFSKFARRGGVSLQVPESGGSFVSDGPVEYVHFYFNESLLQEVAEQLGHKAPACVAIEDFFGSECEILSTLLNRYLARARDADDPPPPIEMDSEAYLIAINLLRDFGRIRTKAEQSEAQVGRHEIRKAMSFMEDNLADPIRLSEIAEAAGLSPYHLIRVFKAESGETPAAFLTRRRTERARDMIVNDAASLAEVAVRSGFSSQSHMTRRLKSAYGLTPRELRTQR